MNSQNNWLKNIQSADNIESAFFIFLSEIQGRDLNNKIPIGTASSHHYSISKRYGSIHTKLNISIVLFNKVLS
tara:strand:+ start:1180 stop:1398 length:219 start_codon:yes stop_codon:yes gene_type:complete